MGYPFLDNRGPDVTGLGNLPTLIWSRPRVPSYVGKNPQSTHGKFMGKSILHGLGSATKYMTRYFIGNLRLHLMHRGDKGRAPHDHPWWFITFPLRSYIEEVAYEVTEHYKEPDFAVPRGRRVIVKRLNRVEAFRFHFRPACYTHRILGPSIVPGLPVELEPYKTGMTLDDVDEVLALAGIPESERMIPTLVLRGTVRKAWGFYTDGHGTWVPAHLYFQNPNYDQ